MKIRIASVAFAWLCVAWWATTVQAADPIRLFGESAVAYAELTQPELILDRLYDPGLVELASQAEGVKQYLASPQYKQLQSVVGLFEGRLNAKWQDALRDLVGGVHLAFDPATEAVVLVVHARRAELLTEAHQALFELVDSTARLAGQESPAKSKEYQGFTGWTFAPDEFHVIIEDLLIVSNKSDALKAAIDRHLDPQARSLADLPEFQQARSAAAGKAAWGMLRLDAVRQIPDVQQALSAKSDNPLAELLIGGIAEALKHAPLATAGLSLDADHAALSIRLPRDAAQASASRAWFFSPEGGGGQAAAPLALPGAIGGFTVYRDVAGMWAAREELFDDNAKNGLAQADAGLGLFFAGRDFGPEVLGELTPQYRLVVARQEFSGEQPTPAIRLPAEALVVQMRNPDEFSSMLLLAYQNVVGATNLNAAQNGQPQMLLASETYHGVEISKASFVAGPETSRDSAPIQFNLSPSCARFGEHFIFGSTTGIVRGVIDALSDPAASQATADNTLVEVDAAAVADALDANRELLISQNMLSEGLTVEQAGERFTALLDLVRLLKKGTIRLTDTAESLTLEVSLGRP